MTAKAKDWYSLDDVHSLSDNDFVDYLDRRSEMLGVDQIKFFQLNQEFENSILMKHKTKSVWCWFESPSSAYVLTGAWDIDYPRPQRDFSEWRVVAESIADDSF